MENNDFTEEELLIRLRNFEDQFVERKTFNDYRDWLRAVVSFANSAPINFPCVLFIGARDNGELEGGNTNLDKMQAKLNDQLKNTFPRVPYFLKIISIETRQALAVIVPGSASRPHFSGPAFVRHGGHTNEMTYEEYRESLAYQNSKAARILDYKGKQVTVINVNNTNRTQWSVATKIDSCNQHYVTFSPLSSSLTKDKLSFSLDRVQLSFDNPNDRLQVELIYS